MKLDEQSARMENLQPRQKESKSKKAGTIRMPILSWTKPIHPELKADKSIKSKMLLQEAIDFTDENSSTQQRIRILQGPALWKFSGEKFSKSTPK